MFNRLLFDRVIASDNQQHHVHSSGTGQHLADELFVAGNVNDADSIVFDFEERVTEFDRDAAFLFFRKSIGVSAGQSSDQGCFAVVDVTRRTQNQITHHFAR